MSAAQTTADRVRVLNDNFRSTFIGGRVLMTQGVDALPIDTKARVILAVQRFDEFSADNDPHREHDFGSFEVEGETYFWKIDYYALDMDGGSEDPTDPEKTTRVLTIMRAGESCPSHNPNRERSQRWPSNPLTVPTPSSNVATAKTTSGSP